MDLQKLYTEITSHYHCCEINHSTLSDTWLQTLKQRKAVPAFELMLNMFAPGNPVNFLVDSRHYLIDPTILDMDDPIVCRLIEIGESDFGSPRKDIWFQGKQFSSDYLHHIGDAARIIHIIHERGISEPTIMEIGGGLAAVAQLLKAYFKDKLTLIMVDLPEILLCQEWYLRACFPDVTTSFKGMKREVPICKGGLNFINAYVLESQNIPIDVAINIDSMQEMTKEAATAYLRYIEKNCSNQGFLYTQNQFGMSASSISEPSEYDLDEYWTIGLAELAYQVETCSESEQARFVFFRCSTPENIQTRRLVLRSLWNGFLTGRISNSNLVVNELSKIPKYLTPSEAISKIDQILHQNEIFLDRDKIECLQESPLFSTLQKQPFPFHKPISNSSSMNFTQVHAESILAVQSKFLGLMTHPEIIHQHSSSIRQQLTQIAADHVCTLQGTESSEFWTAYVGSFLLILGHQGAGETLLQNCHAQSHNPYWQMRFIYLLLRFGLAKSAAMLLKTIKNPILPDYYLELRLAELESQLGYTSDAHARLERLVSDKNIMIPESLSLAKTAITISHFQLAYKRYREFAHFLNEEDFFDLLLTSTSGSLMSNAMAVAFSNELLDFTLSTKQDTGKPGLYAKIAYAILGLRLSVQERLPNNISEALHSLPNNYYLLAQLGKLLQSNRLDDFADTVLEKSIQLRPNAFLHSEYIGNIYLTAGRYLKARPLYQRAVEVKPYLRHIQAKLHFCTLPDELQRANVFCQAQDLDLIFQRKQLFYPELGFLTGGGGRKINS